MKQLWSFAAVAVAVSVTVAVQAQAPTSAPPPSASSSPPTGGKPGAVTAPRENSADRLNRQKPSPPQDVGGTPPVKMPGGGNAVSR
jgi:hypothetical protein